MAKSIKNSPKVLGLDVSTKTIGWALFDLSSKDLLELTHISPRPKPTTDNKKLKIQSIYPYLKHFNILQDSFNSNIEYNKQLLSFNNQAKYDDCADCLSMAVRQIINIK